MYCHADNQGFCQRCGKLLPFSNQDSLCRRSKPHGIGSHLKIILRRFGVRGSAGCNCNQMAKQMNRWGPEEARNNASKILEVMRTEAARRGLPFTDFIAMRILNRAIANAEAEAKRMLDLR